MSENTNDDDEGQGEEGEKNFATKDDLSLLSKTVTAVVDGVKSLTTGIDELKAHNARGDEDEDEDEEVDDLDIERMSRTDFTKHIVDQVSKSVGKPIQDDLAAHKLSTDKAELAKQIQQAQTDHDDFMEYKDEIRALAQQHRSLSPEQLYGMAKLENPDKVKAVEEAKLKADEGNKNKGKSYGGMSGGSGAQTGKQNMNKDEAAEEAWNETMADVPSSLYAAD